MKNLSLYERKNMSELINDQVFFDLIANKLNNQFDNAYTDTYVPFYKL